MLSLDWTSILDNDDVDAAASTFGHILGYLVDRHVPKKCIRPSVGLPWQTPELRRLKAMKRAALRSFSRHHTSQMRVRYIRLNYEYKKMSKRCFSNYQRRIQSRLKSDPKSFWRFLNKQRKQSGLPSSMFLNDKIGSNQSNICQLFSEKFSSVFVDETLTPQSIASALQSVPILGHSLSRINIGFRDILAAASKLKSSSSPGPDGVPSVFLKNCVTGLLAPLQHIFQLSLNSGTFPHVWKAAYVFPVHKKGDRSNVDNYRGISALSAVSKLFELVVIEPVSAFFKQYISETQHGFLPKRSTASNLLSLTTYITEHFDKGVQTDAIYTDLSAAFDRINHDIAIAKFDKLGICGPLLTWFHSYLIGRELNVNIGNCFSIPFAATSGIPQGSHLGPLIFLVYLNDVNFQLKGPRLSYADDLKLFCRVRNLHDATVLQEQLDVFNGWCESNRMLLNPGKCVVISFCRKRETILYDYTLSGTPIAREVCVKDLGVMLDSKLTYKQHITYIVDKASRSLGMIFRIAKDFTDVYCLKSLYCALVRSTLEYCTAVWNPHYSNGIQRIENVQRRFIRFALRRLPWRDPLRLPSYESRCQLIHLDLLQLRRDTARAMIVADLLTGHVDCPALLELVCLQARSRPLRGSALLRIPFGRRNYTAFAAMSGLQRMFNRVSSVFDFNVSRSVVKSRFTEFLKSV